MEFFFPSSFLIPPPTPCFASPGQQNLKEEEEEEEKIGNPLLFVLFFLEFLWNCVLSLKPKGGGTRVQAGCAMLVFLLTIDQLGAPPPPTHYSTHQKLHGAPGKS
eukprot:TRINITY_DN2456_c1_g1_i1.p1 TRINITY_DN2456_c1_g1~~TRINITY_DN2456_c1_g1_i1.p1  ORF type:complete len:105 (+),score=8.41 TRINITY_DN2456_c1_g1_i1:456-770(+)